MSECEELEKKYWNLVRKTPTCWLYEGSASDEGYGRFQGNNQIWVAHRFAYIIHHGKIPKGMCILHKCDVRRCVKPAHLWAGTKAENNHDCDRKGRRNQLFGSKHPQAKLNECNVRQIRKKYIPWTYSQPRLAKEFGVSRGVIYRILRGRKWKHVV